MNMKVNLSENELITRIKFLTSIVMIETANGRNPSKENLIQVARFMGYYISLEDVTSTKRKDMAIAMEDVLAILDILYPLSEEDELNVVIEHLLGTSNVQIVGL